MIQSASNAARNSAGSSGLGLPIRTDLIVRVEGASPVERVYGKRNVRRAHVLGLLKAQVPLSRIEIARQLGYNPSTVIAIVDQLVADGLLKEDSERRPGMGRPATLVSLDGTAASVIGLALGRTSVSAMVMDLNGNILGKALGQAGLPADAQACGQLARQLVAEAVASAASPIAPVGGVAAAIPGIFWTEENGFRRLDPRAAAVEKALQETIGIAPIIDGDALAVALAELWFGKRADLRSFASINIADGLGSILFTHGQYLTGARGNAGDLGHVQLGDPDVPCFCGASACLENVASASGIVRLAKQAGIIGSRSRADAHYVARLAREGRSDAKAVFRRLAEALGLGIAFVVQYADPGTVVIGGPIARHADLFLADLNAVARSHLSRHQRDFELSVSRLDEEVESMGACALVLNRIFGASHLSIESLV